MPPLTHRLARWLMHAYPFPRGSGRLIDRTGLRRLRFAEQTMRVRASGGMRLRIFPNDHIGRHIYLSGGFDHTIVELMLRYCRPGDRILDIGANIGYVSCQLLHRVPDCRLVAVEPQPGCYELLAQNLASVGRGRGQAVCAALSGRSGKGRLRIHETNNGRSHLLAP
ncbi:MAG: FkbM family methyltransferase, partial [Phycisphaeraceae bacterium]|nr:FkbM family methyltransferase [Phycisphaeraceae bacterium]